MQANWPTTGAAGVVVDDGPIVDVVVVDVDVEEVDVVVGVVVDVVVVVDVDVVEDDVAVAVVGEVLDVGAGASVSSTDSLVGADDSVRVVHPAASATVSSTDHDRVPQTSHERPRSHPAILPAVTPGGSSRHGVTAAHRSDVRRARSRP